MLKLEYIILTAPAFLLAITVHEFSHAYIAHRFGDPTAKNMGRLTLNPLPHLDLFGTIALFLIGFGWAKPVIVDQRNLQNPRKNNLWIALGGPASNLISALIIGLAFRFLSPILDGFESGQIMMAMLLLAVRLNIILAVFNLLPIPPLDGYHILEGLVSNDMYIKMQEYERFGSIILLALIMVSSFANLNIFSAIFNPFLAVLGSLFAGQNLAF